MPAKQPRADDLEFRQQVLSRLDVLTAYVQRERSILVEQIRDLRQQLQQQVDASQTERDSAAASQ